MMRSPVWEEIQNMFLPLPSPKNQPSPTWIEGGLHGWVTRGGALGGRSEVPGLNTTYLSLVSTDIKFEPDVN